jgi:hypothetical protein
MYRAKPRQVLPFQGQKRGDAIAGAALLSFEIGGWALIAPFTLT